MATDIFRAIGESRSGRRIFRSEIDLGTNASRAAATAARGVGDAHVEPAGPSRRELLQRSRAVRDSLATRRHRGDGVTP